MRNPTALRNLLLLFAGLALGLSGCTNRGESSTAPTTLSLPVTDIPLRIVVLAPVSDPDSLKRQWRSDSEQPISIQSQTVDAFLAQDRCQADVILYPDHLLGELVAKDWIVKLPDAMQPAIAEELGFDEAREDNESRAPTPRAWQTAAQYEGVAYALPLGCSLPVWVASSAFAEKIDDQDPTLESLQAALQRQSTEPATVPEPAIDNGAIADRFLTLASSLSSRNKKYGLLFDLNTMQPKLNEVEFKQAATILKQLSEQTGGLEATLGSHEFAWTWAATHQGPVLAMASSTLIGPTASKIETGAIIEVADFSSANTGGGLQAGLATSCQQTQQSLEFLKWLGLKQSRALLAPMVQGVDIATPGGVESLAYRSRRSLSKALQSDDLFQEPRMPRAHALRQALGKHLADYLLGKLELDATLEAANLSWAAIQAEPRRSLEEQKFEYQRSLELTN